MYDKLGLQLKSTPIAKKQEVHLLVYNVTSILHTKDKDNKMKACSWTINQKLNNRELSIDQQVLSISFCLRGMTSIYQNQEGRNKRKLLLRQRIQRLIKTCGISNTKQLNAPVNSFYQTGKDVFRADFNNGIYTALSHNLN